MTIGENIFLGREPRRFGLIQWETLYSDAQKILDELHLSLRPDIPVSQLGIGQQHLVEIAKALSRDARILILDEPTAALTDTEAEILFAILERLRARGVGIVYISHKLGEVFRIADRITVLRDGRAVSTDPKSALDQARVIERMVGREVTDLFPTATRAPGEVVFEARGLFQVHRGEVLGIAGLVGAGRSELLMRLFGAQDGASREDVFVDGERVEIRHPSDAIVHGIAFVTEDRKRFGLLLDQSVVRNVTLAILALKRRFFVDADAETADAERAQRELRIKTPSVFVNAMTLSGGNQQKVVLAKWLLTKPKVLFLDEPTRGIDVGAKQEIYAEINRLAAQGMAIVLVSSELPEVLALSDRILVLHEGRVTGEFTRADATPEAVMACATGRSRAA
jgi:D-xylose transport system ATP-binding protein